MDMLKSFLRKRTTGELTFLIIVAAIALFAAGIKVGEVLAVATSAA